MGNYKLTAKAEADLIRIHQRGALHHGEEQADRYFAAFFEHFEQLAEHVPLCIVGLRRGEVSKSDRYMNSGSISTPIGPNARKENVSYAKPCMNSLPP